jgi:sugar phosphate isomerase/epimerase
LKLSVQCYTLRENFAEDAPGTFAAISQIGFRYVELAGMYGFSAAELKDILDRNDLRVNASHVGLDRLQDDLPALADETRTLGCSYLVLPW